jgi:hypothetical protein
MQVRAGRRPALTIGASWGMHCMQPNLSEARKWYERARELGALEAEERLARLGSGGERTSPLGAGICCASSAVLVAVFEIGGDVAVSFQDIDNLKSISDVAEEDYIVPVGRASEVGQ